MCLWGGMNRCPLLSASKWPKLSVIKKKEGKKEGSKNLKSYPKGECPTFCPNYLERQHRLKRNRKLGPGDGTTETSSGNRLSRSSSAPGPTWRGGERESMGLRAAFALHSHWKAGTWSKAAEEPRVGALPFSCLILYKGILMCFKRSQISTPQNKIWKFRTR